MKVFITGAQGFIGRNLIFFLQQHQDIKISTYDIEDSYDKLANEIQKTDFVVHLAGINRPKEAKEFKIGNIDLTKKIVNLLNQRNTKPPLLVTSSIQANCDNDYGKSKKAAEDYILENYFEQGIVFRLHNVFGKYCRPNYNSVVATFCYNIAHGKDITINNPDVEIPLIYIDDICKTFIKLIKGEVQPQKPYNYIEPIEYIKLGELARLLYSFKDDMKSLMVPETGNAFIKKLFSTYTSYCELHDMVVDTEKHTDERGSFSELIHTKQCGQFSVSTSRPGVVRGNHYHHTKIERFIVIKGQAEITLRKIDEKKVHTIKVDEQRAQVVTIPVGYTHSIRNTGDSEMILLIWCNEIFDPEDPDTYFMEVEP